MKLSLEWLKLYVDLPDVTPEDIALKLTMATSEVEEIERLERVVEGVIVGEIVGVEPIDTGDSTKIMNYVTVNTGSGTCKSVCGAPNVAVGVKTAYAPPGTTLAGGFDVSEQTVYGKVSQGMLCSPRELGWGESHLGIFAFPASVETGTSLSTIVPPVDYIIDIDNKTITHRPDLWGHFGFARELAAIYGRKLKQLATADASEWESLPAFPLRIEDLENCPGYCCLDIDNLKPAYSPIWMQYLLLAIGLRPINLMVDLTNFIMCELAQPMHAFDGERVRDVIVKPFDAYGTFVTLDSIKRDMLPEDLMICDHNGPIALAGVMGGEETEIKEDTARVLLESANFNPARIRRTSIRLNLRSDASMRFEKGQPPYSMALSIKRFVQLLRDAGQQPIMRSKLTCEGDSGEKKRTIAMNTDMFPRFIGMNIPRDRITGILASLGFECEWRDTDMILTIPPYRSAKDISIPNDIIEEVARIYGYDNIIPQMPDIEMRPYVFNTDLQNQHKVRRLLSIAKGYSEVHTYSWYDDTWLKRIGYDPGETLVLRNPASDNATRIRKEILPNLLNLVGPNSLHRDRFSIYELGNVHYPAKEGREQRENLAGVYYQSDKLGTIKDMFLAVKGTLEEIFTIVNAPEPRFSIADSPSKPWQQKGAAMDISVDGGNHFGTIGYATDKTWDVLEKGMQVVWFELRLDAIEGPVYPHITFDAIPVYPGSWMDFSILADADSSYDELAKAVSGFSHPILKEVKFLYLYDGKGVPEGKVSYTFRSWLGLDERTLNSDDLAGYHEAFRTYLDSHGLSLRQ